MEVYSTMSKLKTQQLPNTELHKLISNISPSIGRILNKALEGKDITTNEITALLTCKSTELNSVMLTADYLRSKTVGDKVTYVVNRNINFTNVCIKGCGFCAFSRDFRTEESYFLPTEEIIRRGKQAYQLGATELCIQAGLPPKMKGDYYIELCNSIKKEIPEINVHGFSPEEVLYGAVRSKMTIKEYLIGLKDAKVSSLPGTSAEILDQNLRDIISPGRITVDQWIEVITTAHKVGIPTTSTMMYGHIESSEHVAKHLVLLRNIQKSTGGFTEFVPLSFIFDEAPMFKKNSIKNLRKGPTGIEVVKIHAVSRIALNNWIPNIQVSWPKEGPQVAQILLNSGVNDMGGTLMNESISTSAGAQHGQLLRPKEIRKLIWDSERTPAERYTDYTIRKIFSEDDGINDPLDDLDGNTEQIFGSYQQLINMPQYKYIHPNKTEKKLQSPS
jgi:FO synthase subunit 2